MTFSIDNPEGGCNNPPSENMFGKNPQENPYLIRLFFVTYITKEGRCNPQKIYNKAHMMLNYVLVYRSWSCLTLSTKINTKKIKMCHHYDVIYEKTVKKTEKWRNLFLAVIFRNIRFFCFVLLLLLFFCLFVCLFVFFFLFFVLLFCCCCWFFFCFCFFFLIGSLTRVSCNQQ